MSTLFQRTDLLLPVSGTDMSKWSVIACDQHTSEPEYWERLDRFVGKAPSTLRLMLPEIHLANEAAAANRQIEKTMLEYISSGLFRSLNGCFIYVRRSLFSGKIRSGLVGVIDLDQYSYVPDTKTPIRATEGTVEERLPPRVAIRSSAPLEMPHVMVFIDDRENTIFQKCLDLSEGRQPVYDFSLCADGGHITGYELSGSGADAVDAAIDSVFLKNTSCCSAGGKAPVLLAVGDGNHSLAAAKKCGDKYALVELVNIHDPSIVFEPIHRVVFETDLSFLENELPYYDFSVKNISAGADGGRLIQICENSRQRNFMDFSCTNGTQLKKSTKNSGYGLLVAEAERFCNEYTSKHGGKIDYIHNDDTAAKLGSSSGCFAILLPPPVKAELFNEVRENGPYPKKSFSIGLADDKRFYLECRLR